MPVPGELNESTVHTFFAQWRSGSRSLAELADFVEAVALAAVRQAPSSLPAMIGNDYLTAADKQAIRDFEAYLKTVPNSDTRQSLPIKDAEASMTEERVKALIASALRELPRSAPAPKVAPKRPSRARGK